MLISKSLKQHQSRERGERKLFAFALSVWFFLRDLVPGVKQKACPPTPSKNICFMICSSLSLHSHSPLLATQLEFPFCYIHQGHW